MMKLIILSHMKKDDAATLIQNIHRKNHPRGFKVDIFVNPALDVKFKQSAESINVFRNWLNTQIQRVKNQDTLLFIANLSNAYAQFTMDHNGEYKRFEDGKSKRLSSSYQYDMRPWEFWILTQ